MSLLNNHLYAFGSFVLDCEKDVLTVDETPVPLTPKMLNLLVVLVRNHGDIVSKEDLLKQVWEGSFVEEGNLSYTVRQLRKALGDDARRPKYIETIARRGYRFVYPTVNRINEPSPIKEESGKLQNIVEAKSFGIGRTAAIAFSVLLLTASVTAAYFLWGGANSDYRLFTEPYETKSITVSGDSFHPTMSRDGKLIAYVVCRSNRAGVLIHDVERGTDHEVIPLGEGWIGGLAFSPDGADIYFARSARLSEGFTVYRISTFGGTPETVVRGAQGWIDISPDGETISFVRCPYQNAEYCSLWTARAKDGSDERKIVNKEEPFRIGDHEFSPDGRKLAFASGQSRNGANKFMLYAVDLQSGETEPLIDEPFFNIRGIQWMPNGRELLISAKQANRTGDRLFRVRADRSADLVREDSTYFANISVNDNITHAVTETVRSGYEMFEYDLAVPLKKQNLGFGHGAVYTTDGKIIFASDRSGNYDIWIQNKDGTGVRQLTNDSFTDGSPLFSLKGDKVYFTSNRTGEFMVWSMNTDGSEQQQLSVSDGGELLAMTGDGSWLYFRSALSQKLWRINTETREEQLVWDDSQYRFGVSPSGDRIVTVLSESNPKALGIYDAATKELLRTLVLNDQNSDVVQLSWNSDYDAVSYILRERSTRNYTVWTHSLTDEKAKQIADLGNDTLSESSRLFFNKDGTKLLACQGDWKHDVVLIKGLRR